MADNIPTPSGAVPPKKETGKVQPKKETVRINLPPKPSAAPTIKLPALPPGGPTGGAGAPAAPGAPPSSVTTAPRAQAAPISQRSSLGTAPRGPVPSAPALSGLDKGLAIAAAAIGVIAVGSTAYVIWMLPN